MRLSARSAQNGSTPARRKFLGIVLVSAAATLTLAACGASNADISAEGQIDYACALIDDVKAAKKSPEGWTMQVGDDADPAMINAAAAASLAGALTGGGADVSAEMASAGRDIFAGLSRLDAEILQDGVDSFAKECAAR